MKGIRLIKCAPKNLCAQVRTHSLRKTNVEPQLRYTQDSGSNRCNTEQQGERNYHFSRGANSSPLRNATCNWILQHFLGRSQHSNERNYRTETYDFCHTTHKREDYRRKRLPLAPPTDVSPYSKNRKLPDRQPSRQPAKIFQLLELLCAVKLQGANGTGLSGARSCRRFAPAKAVGAVGLKLFNTKA